MAPLPVEQQCAGCFSKGFTGYKKCGACLTVGSCSPGCQRAHWKEHKVLCKSIRASRDEVETKTLSEPLTPVVSQALDHWMKAYVFPIAIAVTAALDANSPEDKTRSHVAQISLEWRGAPRGDVSEQFKVDRIEALDNADYLSQLDRDYAGNASQSSGLRCAASLSTLQSYYTSMRDEPNDLWIKVGYLVRVRYGTDRAEHNGESGRLDTLGTLLIPRSKHHPIPSLTQKVPILPNNPRWESFFKYDTSSPPLSAQGYQDLTSTRRLLSDPADRLFQRETEAFMQSRGGQAFEEEQTAFGTRTDAITANSARKTKKNIAK